MSCETKYKQFCVHPAITGSDTPAAVAFGSPKAAQQAFDEIFAIARNQSAPADPEALRLIEAQTRLLFIRMTQLAIEPPSHSKTGLPKADAQRGYAAIWQSLQALESNRPLPLLAQQVRDAQKQRIAMASLARAQHLVTQTRTDRGDTDAQALEHLLDDLPALTFDGETAAVIHTFAAGILRRDQASIQIERVQGEGAKGVSGAPVYFVRDLQRKRLAVVKVFPRADEFAREFSALERLNAEHFQTFTTPALVGVAQTTVADRRGGVIVMSVVAGTSLDDAIIATGNARGAVRRSAFAELRAGVAATARALAELHTKPAGSGRPVSQAYLDRHIGALRDITHKLIANPRVASLPEFDGSQLQQRVDALIIAANNDPGGSALVHGDAHPGNFFYNAPTPATPIAVIDVPTLHLSMDASGAPIGAPARDYANFEQKLVHFGIVVQKSSFH